MSTERVVEREHVEQESSPIDPRAEDNSVQQSDPNLSRDPGAGSLSRDEAWVAENERDGMNDGRYDTRTTLYAWDADTIGPSQKHRDPSDRRSWSDFAKWNDGMWAEDRSVQNYNADVKRWTETFCTQLELPEYQQERVQYVVDDIEMKTFRSYRFSAEKVILGVISLVIDSEVPRDPERASINDWILWDEDFQSLMMDVDMTTEDGSPDLDPIWEIRKIVPSETDYQFD